MNTFASFEPKFVLSQNLHHLSTLHGGSKYGPMSTIGLAQSGHFLGVPLASFAKLFLQSKQAQCVYIPIGSPLA